MTRLSLLLGLGLALTAAPAVAQDEEPATSFDTYCLTVDVPAGTTVDESTILDDPSIVTVVELTDCGGAGGDDSETAGAIIPKGSTVSVLDAYTDDVFWNVSIDSVNNSAWKPIRKANQFNDKPQRGNRYVMVTVRIGHDERGVSYDPNLDWELWGPDESYEAASVVMPKNLKNRYEVDGIPGGRSTTFGLVFEVPNKVKANDLVLTVTGDEYAELAIS